MKLVETYCETPSSLVAGFNYKDEIYIQDSKGMLSSMMPAARFQVLVIENKLIRTKSIAKLGMFS